MSRPGHSAVWIAGASRSCAEGNAALWVVQGELDLGDAVHSHGHRMRSGEVCDELRSGRAASRFGAVLPKGSCARSATRDPVNFAWSHTPIRPSERAVRGHRVSLRIGRAHGCPALLRGAGSGAASARLGLAAAQGEYHSAHAERGLSRRRFLCCFPGCKVDFSPPIRRIAGTRDVLTYLSFAAEIVGFGFRRSAHHGAAVDASWKLQGPRQTRRYGGSNRLPGTGQAAFFRAFLRRSAELRSRASSSFVPSREGYFYQPVSGCSGSRSQRWVPGDRCDLGRRVTVCRGSPSRHEEAEEVVLRRHIFLKGSASPSA